MFGFSRKDLTILTPAEATFNVIANFSESHGPVSAYANKKMNAMLIFVIFFQIFIVYLLCSSQVLTFG